MSALPPIGTSGSIGHTFRTTETPEEDRDYINQSTGTLRARSYIWQPWFVTAEAGANVAYENVAGDDVVTGDSLIWSGDANLGILPVSRYPATLSYSRTDSRTEGTFGSDFVSDRANATAQAIFSNNLRAGARATYERINEEGGDLEEFKSVGLDVLKIFERSQISLALSHIEDDLEADEGRNIDVKETDDIATLRHIYQPSHRLRADSTVTLLHDTDETPDLEQNRLLTQGTSTAYWQLEETPITLNGALRAFRETSEFEADGSSAGDSEAITTSGTLGMNYPIRPRLTANLGLNGTYETTESDRERSSIGSFRTDRRTIDTTLIAGANYFSLPEPVAGFQWSWNASAQAEPSYRDETGEFIQSQDEGFSFSGGAAVGQAVERGLDVPFLGESLFSASQLGRVTRTEDDDTIPNLTHNVSLTYSSVGAGTQTMVRLSGLDTRDFAGDTPTEFSLAQLLLNREVSIDVDSGWRGGLSLSGSRRKFDDQEADIAFTANGTLGYFARAIFGVRDLDFRSDLTLRALGLEELIENEDEPQLGDRELRAEWTNILDYRLGRITVSIEAQVFYADEEFGETGFGNSVIFRIRRDFATVF